MAHKDTLDTGPMFKTSSMRSRALPSLNFKLMIKDLEDQEWPMNCASIA